MAKDAICKNPECLKKFKRKNSKKVYCSLTCKNRYNYTRYLKENKRDIEWQKGYDNNKVLIKGLYNRNELIVPISFLKFMGFKFECLREKLYTKDGKTAYYIIGDYFLISDTNNQCRIEKIKLL